MEDPNMIEIMEIEERLAMDSGEAPEKLEPYEEPEIDNSIVEYRLDKEEYKVLLGIVQGGNQLILNDMFNYDDGIGEMKLNIALKELSNDENFKTNVKLYAEAILEEESNGE